MADRDAAIRELVESIVGAANLSPRREVELHQAAVARFRRLADVTEQAVVAALALDREERSADQHVQGLCSWCSSRRLFVSGVCRGFRAIRRRLDRLHHDYRRSLRRLERA
jgi:hypothetical protein